MLRFKTIDGFPHSVCMTEVGHFTQINVFLICAPFMSSEYCLQEQIGLDQSFVTHRLNFI